MHRVHGSAAKFAAIICATLAPAAALAQHVVIKDADVFDGTGGAPRKADISIVDGRIQAVGEKLAVPAGAKVVDARGMTALPGLFDLHTHWGRWGKGATTKPEIAAAYLRSGVTTVYDFSPRPEALLPLRSWFSTFAAPDVRFAARMTTPKGHGDEMGEPTLTARVSSPEEARNAVRAISAYKPDLIKVFTDGWRYGRAADMTSMDLETLRALTDEARRQSLRVVTHTVTVERANEAAAAQVSAVVHALQNRPVDARSTAFLKKSGMPVVPTLAVYEPLGWKPRVFRSADVPPVRFDGALANVKELFAAGIPVGVGTDSGIARTVHGKSTLRELELLVIAGLTPGQALVAATSTSAKIAGLDVDRGTITAGKRADIVLVRGSPWKDIRDIYNVSSVMLNGKFVVENGADRLPDANGKSYPPAVQVGAQIDDFERQDGRSSLDTLRFDHFDDGYDRSRMATQVVARDGGGKALRVSATMADKADAYAGVVIPLARGAVYPVELSKYSGIRFDARGDGELTFRLVGYDGLRRAKFTTDGSWKTVKLSLSDLSAPQGQANAKLTMPHQIEFISYRPAGSTLWFEIDNVELF